MRQPNKEISHDLNSPAQNDTSEDSVQSLSQDEPIDTPPSISEEDLHDPEFIDHTWSQFLITWKQVPDYSERMTLDVYSCFRHWKRRSFLEELESVLEQTVDVDLVDELFKELKAKFFDMQQAFMSVKKRPNSRNVGNAHASVLAARDALTRAFEAGYEFSATGRLTLIDTLMSWAFLGSHKVGA